MLFDYYNSENGKVYDNRYDAVYDKYHNNEMVYFYYRDEEYDKINWKIEPSENLAQLYKERAQQIRDTYDYVVLCYSGGIDSTNVLESFYYNNIHIDEIVSVGSFSQDTTKDIDLNHNKDIYDNVATSLNAFHLPNTKKSFIDYTTYFNDLNNFSLYKEYNAEYYKYIGAYPSVTYLFWYDLPKFLNLKRNSIIIYGIEKPFIQRDEFGKFFVQFSDSSIKGYSKYNISGIHRTNFYSDPESEKILRKQFHTIINHYNHQEYKENYLNPETYTDTIHKLIYDLKNPLRFISKKGTNVFFSGRDKFLKYKQNSDIYNFYGKAMKHMVDNYSLNFNSKYNLYTKKYYFI